MCDGNVTRSTGHPFRLLCSLTGSSRCTEGFCAAVHGCLGCGIPPRQLQPSEFAHLSFRQVHQALPAPYPATIMCDLAQTLQAAQGRGPLCSRALRYACDFFDLDVFLVEEADVSAHKSAQPALFDGGPCTAGQTPLCQRRIAVSGVLQAPRWRCEASTRLQQGISDRRSDRRRGGGHVRGPSPGACVGR